MGRFASRWDRQGTVLWLPASPITTSQDDNAGKDSESQSFDYFEATASLSKRQSRAVTDPGMNLVACKARPALA